MILLQVIIIFWLIVLSVCGIVGAFTTHISGETVIFERALPRSIKHYTLFGKICFVVFFLPAAIAFIPTYWIINGIKWIWNKGIVRLFIKVSVVSVLFVSCTIGDGKDQAYADNVVRGYTVKFFSGVKSIADNPHEIYLNRGDTVMLHRIEETGRWIISVEGKEDSMHKLAIVQ